jgi:hypothetical protein
MPWREEVRKEGCTGVVGVNWLLELDTSLLLAGGLLGAKVAVALGVGGILRGWLLRVILIIAIVGLLVLVWGRIAWGRSHPSCAGVRAETVVATATSVEASVLGEK